MLPPLKSLELKHIILPGFFHQFNYLYMYSCYIENISQCLEASGLTHASVKHAMKILHIRWTVLPWEGQERDAEPHLPDVGYIA